MRCYWLKRLKGHLQWTDSPIRFSYGINCPIILKHEKDLTANGNVLISLFGHFINSLIVMDMKNGNMKFYLSI